ncbi:cell division protein ZipA [Thalassotalea castellviae]|uniref:Cell division protein ZipA n=1 Tax=Thalassotalea castellviae TaxID=3075612 RepID=A0ABU2ZXE4_9GAMM|nr:cell division protein ZipA [Thalassotalea sp. W431]MDT0602210.1 cell division protein ZipA [Thalassotalea sp. W431]
MEDNFRNVLIIISAIIIAAIFIHGFWTIRKNKNPYKLKAKNEKVEPQTRGFDGSGFDQDGVGKAKVIGVNTLNDNEIPSEAAPAPSFDEEPLPIDVEKPSAEQPALEPALGDLSDISEQPPKVNTPHPAQTSELAPEQIQIDQPVYQQPVEQQKPSIKPTAKSKAKGGRKTTKEKLARNQMEINFGGDIEQAENEELSTSSSAHDQSTQSAAKENKKAIDPEVIVVSVVMPENNNISGAALLPTLLTLGLRFGDMDIFHRHEDNAGNGKVTFSLANMMNPGTFDLDEIESFNTQGVTLFMTLPNEGDPFEVFAQMMSAAKQLSMEFNAQLLDDKRSVMTKQTEQHYIGKIREFERRNRIASA